MVEPPGGLTEPPEALADLVAFRTVDAGLPLHRIHADRYAPAQFNPGTAGNARFSPIRDAASQPIATLYAASSFEAAAMETVFHDVSLVAGLKTLDTTHLQGLAWSMVAPKRPLRLVDLSSTALRRLGTKRRALIDTPKSDYPRTRRWAEAVHSEVPAADGLWWVSRQDDRAEAIMLYGDRVQPDTLDVMQAPQALLHELQVSMRLLELTERIGVCFVSGRIGSELPF